jgi:uroporphyrinogen-III synthase
MTVDEMFMYRVRPARVTQTWKKFYRMLLDKKIDVLVFTSASNVRSFFEIIDKLGGKTRIDRLVQVVSIGPFTSAELEKRGIKYREAEDHTIQGTVRTAMKLFTGRSG